MIYYITGGERSGKSRYAETLALSLADNPVYLATAKVWDKNFADRIKNHQQNRDQRWTNLEAEIEISQVILPNRVVLIDCITLWLTNLFFAENQDKQQALIAAKAEFDRLRDYSGTLIFVSNEIGMGVHAENQTARDFVELQGWMNQYVAQAADTAYLMVSGLPLQLK